MSVKHGGELPVAGNGVYDAAIYDDSTGAAQVIGASLSATVPLAPSIHHCSDLPGTNVRCTEYLYDQFINLAQQSKRFYPALGSVVQTGSPQVIATENYQYDELQRLLGESRGYTNMTPSSTLSETYAYDDIGNITAKSDFGGAYSYGNATRPSGAGPHAVLSVASKGSYTYDRNGNMLSDGSRTVGYDGLDRPVTITLGGVTTTFAYAPDGERYLQRTVTPDGNSRSIYYVDKLYERVDWDRKPSEERTYVGPSVVVEQQDGSARQVRYLHLDRLGSVDAVTGDGGAEVLTDAHGFDAFGGPRSRDWQPSGWQLHPTGEFGTTTNHGFTGHEHLDETYLIHMNGRVYDYRLGRFLSVDPLISNPASSQSINPYSYIGNNPLSGVDPTGYEEKPVGFEGCTPATGSHVCGSTLENSASPITANGERAVTHSNGAEPLGSQLPSGTPDRTNAPGKCYEAA